MLSSSQLYQRENRQYFDQSFENEDDNNNDNGSGSGCGSDSNDDNANEDQHYTYLNSSDSWKAWRDNFAHNIFDQ